MVAKLFSKRKPALLVTLGSAAGFIIGGAVALSLLQRRPTLVGMPTGTEVIPQDAIMTLAFSTDKGQWQQLRRFGTSETQTALDQKLAQLRDRLLTNNGLNYQRDIQPWIGGEITAAFLMPPSLNTKGQPDQKVQPYDPAALAAGEQSAVMVMPIADPAKAQQLLSTPKVSARQDWVDRDYRGISIREVQGQTERSYAAAVLDNRFVVVSGEGKSIERVIDTFKGGASVAQTPGYSQALSHVATVNPFMQLYVNLPAANALTQNNANQPVPPQILSPLQGNQGLATAMTLESEGIRLQSVSWLAPNSKNRFKVTNNAERMQTLLPSDALMVASGGNLKQLWQNYTQQPSNPTQAGPFNPDALRRGLNNLAGLDLDQDLITWMNGEYALALVSAPDAKGTANAKSGLMLMLQTTDRKAAEQTFKQLDELMKTRYRFQVSETQVSGQPATNWVSPFTALNVTHGWLDGNIAFLTVGPDLASTIVPAPAKPLSDNPLFRQTTSTDLNPNNGHFFIEVDRLFNAEISLPVPNLPPENQAFLKAIRAIGMTTALQDGRTTRYDTRVLLRKGNTPGALPSPSTVIPPANEPETAPSPQ